MIKFHHQQVLMFPTGSLNCWSSFQGQGETLGALPEWLQTVFPHRALASLRGRPETICQKLTLTCWCTVLLKMWPPDTYLKPALRFGKWWRSDNTVHEHGFNIGEVRMCMQVTVEQAGRKDFQGCVLGESVTVSRRIKAAGAARRTFFLFHTRKLLFSDAARRL